MPIYMLPKVKALLNRSVWKYLAALFQMLSKGCSRGRYGRKLGLAMLKRLVKFFLSTWTLEASW